MRYLVILKPETASGLTDTVRDADGVEHVSVVLGALGDGDVARANVRTNLAELAIACLEDAVQPSTAQQAGLLAYLAAIQAAADTSSVETAIGAL
jgi:hypothetical protein